MSWVSECLWRTHMFCFVCESKTLTDIGIGCTGCCCPIDDDISFLLACFCFLFFSFSLWIFVWLIGGERLTQRGVIFMQTNKSNHDNRQQPKLKGNRTVFRCSEESGRTLHQWKTIAADKYLNFDLFIYDVFFLHPHCCCRLLIFYKEGQTTVAFEAFQGTLLRIKLIAGFVIKENKLSCMQKESYKLNIILSNMSTTKKYY